MHSIVWISLFFIQDHKGKIKVSTFFPQCSESVQIYVTLSKHLGLLKTVSFAVVWLLYGGDNLTSWKTLKCYFSLRCLGTDVFQTLYECNEWHSFHARVGRFSPFLYLRSVAIAVILFWLQLVVLVFPCFLGSRIPRDYRFPRAPLFLCSERKSS